MDQDFLVCHTAILCNSYQHWTGLRLLDNGLDSMQAMHRLFNAPYALVSHDTQADPVFNYANAKAQQLFGMDWKEFTGLPSRYSAELASQDDRAGLLQRVTQHGFADNYSGIRIAKNGARFNIGNATVWNLLDKCGYYCGQAALIRQWQAI